MKLNSVFEFTDLMTAVRFSREKADSYKTEGMTVNHFNGHDWVWYAVNLSSGDDKGIILQIFCKDQVSGDILIPTEEYSLATE